MNHLADGAQAPRSQERPAAELVRQLSEQVSVLVREEVKLARLEVTRKGKQAGAGAGMLGGAGLVALYGAGCLIACAVLAISTGLAAWLAALIVGVALLAAAGAAALLGKSRLQKNAPPVPTETVEQLAAKADVKGQAQAKMAVLSGRVKESTGQVRARAAERGAGLRSQVAGKAVTTRQKAGTAKAQLQARAASVWDAAPEPVRRTAARGVSIAGQRRVPLIAAVAMLITGYLAGRWRRKQ